MRSSDWSSDGCASDLRVACLFDTEYGPMAIVLVGAMIVASIETVWAGLVTPHKRQVRAQRYDAAARAPTHLDKGAEMGRFKLGRSEEHTSELQSLMRISYAVFCLKKKTCTRHHPHITDTNHMTRKDTDTPTPN